MELDALPEEGPYPELARQVKKILRRTQPNVTTLSTRLVCRKLGMSHETVAGMAGGHRPSRALLLEFAVGMRASANDLLTAAGYPLLAEKREPQG